MTNQRINELAKLLTYYADAIEDELFAGSTRSVGDMSDCASPVMRDAALALALAAHPQPPTGQEWNTLAEVVDEHLKSFDDYPTNPVPFNRNGSTVRALRRALDGVRVSCRMSARTAPVVAQEAAK